MASNIKHEVEEEGESDMNGVENSHEMTSEIKTEPADFDENQPSTSGTCINATSMPKLYNMLVDEDKVDPVGVYKNPLSAMYGKFAENVQSTETCQEKGNSHEKAGKFHVNRDLIPAANIEDQSIPELFGLGLDVFNQEDFEQGVMEQIDHQLAAEEEERKKKVLEKEKKNIVDDIIMVQRELIKIDKLLNSSPAELLKSGPGIHKKLEAARRQKENKMNQLKKLTARNKSISAKLNQINDDDQTINEQGGDLNQVLGLGPSTSQNESERERMIRLGEMTPFGTVISANRQQPTERASSSLQHKSTPKISLSQDSAFDMFLSEKDQQHQVVKKKITHKDNTSSKDHSEKTKHISRPHSSKDSSLRKIQSEPSFSKKRKDENIFDKKDKQVYRNDVEGSSSFKSSKHGRKYPRLKHNFTEDSMMSDEEEMYGEQEEEGYVSSDPEYHPPERERDAQNVTDDEDDVRSFVKKPKKRKLRDRIPVPEFDAAGNSGSDSGDNAKARKRKFSSDVTLRKSKDDGDDYAYENRLKDFNAVERLKMKRMDTGEETISDEDEEFDGGLKVPGRIWCKLFKYQKTGVRWLWELHQQEAGGIIGDEMGLGKTIQMIAFLAALRQSKLQSQHFRYIGLGPTLIVCPTTVMHQWVKEFHKWWPLFRVGVLHSSGTYTSSEKDLVRTIAKEHGVIVTSYSSLVIHQDILLKYNWHYVVLDEGHKIRNPDTQATLVCKQFRTPHRIILSGSPIQNNLKELWSLFDFVFPGKLGTLPDFMAHFSVPIVQGGYANASQIQVTTAYKCACVLRDTINPYLLRRMKADVDINLPTKNEQVLFCKLADEQREVYKEYLQSRECQAILAGKFQIFAGLIMLRKICNHPDLSTGGPRVFVGQNTGNDPTLEFGYPGRSGKMLVVEALLRLWKKQGHRVVLFSQSRSMLDILESFVQREDYSYLRMDGGTSIGSRQPMIDRFNKDKSLYLFLLTTRVGGLGVNLVGANRVIIFDPDWNPSTDTQARERTWRIGQKRNVTIYRLITSGTIEEKIYHRQIFKQFLANRVLKDPKQRRFFKANDLYELFDLGVDDSKGGTETAAIFAGIGSEVRRSDLKVNKPDLVSKKSETKVNRFDKMREEKIKSDSEEEEETEHFFDECEVKKMRELAKMLSQKLVGGKKDTDDNEPNGKNANTDILNEIDISNKVSHSIAGKHDETSTEKTESGKKKKKHKKKRKGAKFEGKRIPNLVKHGEYKPGSHSTKQEQSKNNAMDDYVLGKLFKNTGIQGALKHDVIMDPTKHDYMIVEAEADKVAKEAVAALKRSRSQCAGPLSGLPTWTGHHGGINKKPRFGQKKNSMLISKQAKPSTSTAEKTKVDESPDKSKSGMFDGTLAGSVITNSDKGASGSSAMTSNELLLKMKQRNEISRKPTDNGSDDDQSTGVVDPKDAELLSELRNHILFECNLVGQASTQEILDKFGSKLPPSDSVKFRAMLNEICDFERINDIGFWRLRGEFR